MESNLVRAFTTETNCNAETAFEYLQANCWDIHQALESWHHLHGTTYTEEENQDIFERNEVKKLSRGISRATDNVNLVSRARCEYAEKFARDFFPKVNWFAMDTPDFSFTLPDLNIYGEDFRKFLDKDLIENSTIVSLEQSGRLNWWVESGNAQGPCQRLWPLSTTGDGNCLLHAASLAIWGFHDRLLTLRKALHSFLESSKHIPALYRRWRWQQTKLNEQSGFVYSEEEWLKEWQNIVNMASVEPRKNGNSTNDRTGGGVTSTTAAPSTGATSATAYSASTYESLEEIHVLVLAHVLRRPIIVVADTMLRDMNNEPFAPIPFGGIYLPMEFQAKDCHRSPLLLAYDMAHFSALVAMESVHKEKLEKLFAVIPIVDSDGVLLPVQFCVDPGVNHNWFEKHEQALINSLLPGEKDQITLVKKYLDVVDLTDNDAVSPDNDSEDEIEKRFIEVTDLSDSENTLFSSKNRAAKQLQSVARQFGSIGKSMSKKLRKNFGSITKVAAKPKKSDSRNRMLCAEIHHKRHAYQEEMIKNYLIYAQQLFLRDQIHKLVSNGSHPDYVKLQEQALLEGPLKCINANCDSFGTVLTSYMCENCYETQRNEELLNINPDSRFGTGRSKFYRDSDMESYDAIKNIPVTKSNMNPDRTLYLSKSTFYYDNNDPIDMSMQQNKTNTRIIPIESSSIPIANNDAASRDDSNANSSKKEASEVRHISKFDFGNINQNVNRNFITPGSSSSDKVNQLTESDLECGKYDCNLPSDFVVLSGQNDCLPHYLQKKRNRLLKVRKNEDGGKKGISGSSSTMYHTIHDVNENKNFPNRDKRSEIDRDASINVTTSNLNDLTFNRPNTIEPRLKMAYSTALQRCKTNNCANLASAHTDFYCTDCNKKRMAGITL